MGSRMITKHTIWMCVFTILVLIISVSASVQNQQAPKISDDERKALEKINTAADIAGKLQAASEYLKKYGKSHMRSRIVPHLVGEVAKVQDPASQVALVHSFSAIFDRSEEIDLIKPILIDAYIRSNKYDEAFQESAKYLERHPEDVITRTQLAVIGADKARQQDLKFVVAGQQYGAEAIQLMEADKRPERMEAAAWATYRNQWLPRLYQAQGVMLYVGSNNRASAKDHLERAIGLDPQDPVTLMLLGTLADDEYQQIAKQFNTEKPGPGKDALLKQAQIEMDKVIDWFARAIAASDGKPQYQAMQQQLMQNLQSYYSYRHNGSTEGVKQLIEKYKKPVGQ